MRGSDSGTQCLSLDSGSILRTYAMCCRSGIMSARLDGFSRLTPNNEFSEYDVHDKCFSSNVS